MFLKSNIIFSFNNLDIFSKFNARALNFEKISKLLKEKIIFDLRNIYIPKDLKDMGYEYYGTGK